MKNIKFIFGFVFLLALAISCTVDGIDDDTSFINSKSSYKHGSKFDDFSSVCKIALNMFEPFYSALLKELRVDELHHIYTSPTPETQSWSLC